MQSRRDSASGRSEPGARTGGATIAPAARRARLHRLAHRAGGLPRDPARRPLAPLVGVRVRGDGHHCRTGWAPRLASRSRRPRGLRGWTDRPPCRDAGGAPWVGRTPPQCAGRTPHRTSWKRSSRQFAARPAPHPARVGPVLTASCADIHMQPSRAPRRVRRRSSATAMRVPADAARRSASRTARRHATRHVAPGRELARCPRHCRRALPPNKTASKPGFRGHPRPFRMVGPAGLEPATKRV
jgi:hypothetical protein